MTAARTQPANAADAASPAPAASGPPRPRPSQRSHVPSFEVVNILNRVNDLRHAGHEVLSMCAGEPSTGAPGPVKRRLAALMSEVNPLGYTASFGITPLRERLAQHYLDWYGVRVPTERIAVTTGSSGAFAAVFLAAFNPGDRVALARPGYPAYRNILEALGCVVVDIDCGPETRFQPTPALLDRALTEHGELHGLIVASPANPTGTMVTREQLAALGEWCDAHAVRLVSDEIYHGLVYGDEPATCALEVAPNAIVISSFSKYWGMTGWRLGWSILPEDLVPGVDALAGNIALCAPVPAQIAAVEAFTPEAYAECEANLAAYRRQRALLLDTAPALGWRDLAPADGAFYFYGRLSEEQLARHGGTSMQWCADLLAEHGVAMTPGFDFDRRLGHETVRLSFACTEDVLARSLTRILEFQS
ncbi:aminotransferase class I/II-fold pyridoxal phosphate-dependent enzyme [Micrococcales bacterium 31B]|nr:aminotransferase class I/II-fold pyridoxal phosphate-dependent enzyme [Micrococcales bacterium 31B]